jgi:hypothetical protein
VRQFVRSDGYARARLFSGTVMIVLGIVVVARMFLGAGLDWHGIPGYVLGLALIGLGVVRFREYAARTKGPTQR